jgi:hypothetical protein
MNKNKLRQRDPEAAWVRTAVATRRVGANAKCACGETRPQALIQKSNPTICHRCKREKDGKTTMDKHHVAGQANSSVRIAVPVNDHRADLTVAQQDWPKATRENPDRSPLLAFAGCVRGFADTITYLVKKLLFWGAFMLEALDTYFAKKLGPRWWIGTELAKFAPNH